MHRLAIRTGHAGMHANYLHVRNLTLVTLADSGNGTATLPWEFTQLRLPVALFWKANRTYHLSILPAYVRKHRRHWCVGFQFPDGHVHITELVFSSRYLVPRAFPRPVESKAVI